MEIGIKPSRNIELLGSPSLRGVAKPVDVSTDDSAWEVMKDMAALMKIEGGIGIAAPQIGEPLRIIAIGIDLSTNERLEHPIFLINPEIVLSDGIQYTMEACLSVPLAAEMVKRPKLVKVSALDENTKEIVVTGEDLGASVLCHEIDHLNGILFIDHLGPVKRDVLVRKAKKYMKLKSRIERE